MRKVFILVLLIGFTMAGAYLEARTLTGGRGIPVVSDPKDLNLLNLKNMSEYLYNDLKSKGDFGIIRRTAVAIKAKQIGIPNPRKKILFGGAVIGKGSGNNSSAILVLMGDLQYKEIKESIEKDYREYMEVNRGSASVQQEDINGVMFEKFGYSERPYETCIGQVKDRKTIILAAVPKDDHRMLEETIKVVLGQETLNEAEPGEVETETTFVMTQRERERLVNFNKSKGGLRSKFAKGMKTLAQKLGIPQSDDATVPLDERIRGLIGISKQVSIKYKWDVDSNKAAAYTINYSIAMPSPETAEALRGLIAEQIVRLSETADHSGDRDSLGRLTVSTAENNVEMNFLLDSPESQFQHTSLLLSQGMHYKSIFSFLDRDGGNAKAAD